MSAVCYHTGVVAIWGPPDYGDPHPYITSDMGMGVTISLSDMRLPQVHITLGIPGDIGIPRYELLLLVTFERPRYSLTMANGCAVHKLVAIHLGPARASRR